MTLHTVFEMRSIQGRLVQAAGGFVLMATLMAPAFAQDSGVQMVADAPSLNVAGVSVTGPPNNQPVSTTQNIPTVGFGTLTVTMTVQNTGATSATGCIGWLQVNKYPVMNNAYFDVKQPLPDLAPGQSTTMSFTVPNSPGGKSVGTAMVWTGGAASKLADNFFYYNVANVPAGPALNPTGPVATVLNVEPHLTSAEMGSPPLIALANCMNSEGKISVGPSGQLKLTFTNQGQFWIHPSTAKLKINNDASPQVNLYSFSSGLSALPPGAANHITWNIPAPKTGNFTAELTTWTNTTLLTTKVLHFKVEGVILKPLAH